MADWAPPAFEVRNAGGESAASVIAAHALAAQEGPLIIGVAGSVAVGKSRCAFELRTLLEGGRRVEVVSTDGFLFPNATLVARGLFARKGFPESYDAECATDVLARIASGEAGVAVPRYSHRTYDIEGPPQVVDRPDVVVLEGIVALHAPFRDFCSVGVYLDAEEADLRRWYVERFVELVVAGEGFYAQWAGMGGDEVRALASMVWEHVNLPNLTDHILPTRWTADVVVRKGADHTATAVAVRRR